MEILQISNFNFDLGLLVILSIFVGLDNSVITNNIL